MYQANLINEVFTDVKILPSPINSNFDDFGLSLDKEGSNILFSSARPGKGGDDLFQISLPQSINEDQVPETLLFKVKIQDNLTNRPIIGKELKLAIVDLEAYGLQDYNEADILKKCKEVNATAFSIKTDNNGEQIFSVDTQTKYVLLLEVPGYKESRFFYDPLSDDQSWVIGLEPKEIKRKVITTTPVVTEPSRVIIPTTKGSKIVFDNIYYEYNSAVIKGGAAEELDALVATMRELPNLKIQLTAHTDSRGNDDYNLNLSNERAKSAKLYLVNKGISASRILALGLGETQIRNHCYNGVTCTDEDHQFNRRTEVKILDN